MLNPALDKVKTLSDKIHLSKYFQLSVTFVILISALLIGAQTYPINSQVLTIIHIFDFLVSLFFLLEIIIRLIAIGSIKKFFSSGWNWFDLIIVIGSLIPFTDNIIILGRLLRVFRVLRLITLIPELRVLINALFKALPPMGYVLLLMFIIFYVYAAIGSTLFENINPTLWGNIAISMLTLFRVITFEDWTDVMYETMEIYPLSWIFYLSFIFLNAFVFLNMMIGIVLEKMQRAHEQESNFNQQEVLLDIQKQLTHLNKNIKTVTSQKTIP